MSYNFCFFTYSYINTKLLISLALLLSLFIPFYYFLSLLSFGFSLKASCDAYDAFMLLSSFNVTPLNIKLQKGRVEYINTLCNMPNFSKEYCLQYTFILHSWRTSLAGTFQQNNNKLRFYMLHIPYSPFTFVASSSFSTK